MVVPTENMTSVVCCLKSKKYFFSEETDLRVLYYLVASLNPHLALVAFAGSPKLQ